MTDLEYKIAIQFKEVFERLSVLEQDIKRHEQIALTAFFILSALGILSFFRIRKLVRSYIKEKTDEGLKPVLTDASATVAKQLQEIRKLSSEASGIILMLQEAARRGQGIPRFDIQLGEREVTFSAAYLTMDVVFPRKFATVPKIYVGEGRGGAWVIVKVDEKYVDRFRWAANNLVPNFPYTTIIQWIAIAEIAPPDAAGAYSEAEPERK
jgi:hypothetical protein